MTLTPDAGPRGTLFCQWYMLLVDAWLASVPPDEASEALSREGIERQSHVTGVPGVYHQM